MMLPGYALIAQGIQIHVSSWPSPGALELSQARGLLLTQALSFHGCCYAIAVAGIMNPENMLEQFRDPALERPKIARGSCIIDPSASLLAEAPGEEEAIIIAQGSLETIRKCKTNRDIAGHYSRPDVLQLMVNRQKLERAVFSDPGEATAESALNAGSDE